MVIKAGAGKMINFAWMPTGSLAVHIEAGGKDLTIIIPPSDVTALKGFICSRETAPALDK